MDLTEKTAKKLVDSMDRLAAATERQNKLTEAVLKASGKQAPRETVQNVPVTDSMLSKFVDGA